MSGNYTADRPAIKIRNLNNITYPVELKDLHRTVKTNYYSNATNLRCRKAKYLLWSIKTLYVKLVLGVRKNF